MPAIATKQRQKVSPLPAKPKHHTADAEQLVSGIADELLKLNVLIESTESEMAELKREGLIYASPWWRPRSGNDKLYLNYPQKMRDGKERKRVYIGDDPKKVAAALAGVERAKTYDEKARELNELKRRLDAAEGYLMQVKGALAGHYWSRWS